MGNRFEDILLLSMGSKTLFPTTCAEASGCLECIVDPPLQTSEGTDHNDTSGKAARKKVSKSNLRSDGAEGLTLVGCLSDLRNKRVGRVGYDGTDNTCRVSRQESNSELSVL